MRKSFENAIMIIKRALKGLMRRYLGTQIIKIHYLGKKIVPLNSDVDRLVRPLSFDDFLVGDKEEFTPAKLEVIQERFQDKSYKAFGIKENDQLIYSCWISFEKLGIPIVINNPIRLKQQQGYLEDMYCSISARGKGLHTKMISYCLSRLYDYGKTEGIITIIDGNVPALKASIKSGMNDIGVFYCGRILWRPFCTLSDKTKSIFDSKL